MVKDNDDGTGVSRASSVSGKDKSNLGKGRRKRRDDSESFDSRSQYTPYYSHPQQPTWVSPQYLPVGSPQYNGQVQQPYPSAMQPAYGPPAGQSYPQMMPTNGFIPQYNNLPTVRSHANLLSILSLTNTSSTRLSQPSRAIRVLVDPCRLMDRRCKLLLPSSNGSNQVSIRVRIRRGPRLRVQEYRMHTASFRPTSTPMTRRASTLSRAATTATTTVTVSTRRRNHLFLAPECLRYSRLRSPSMDMARSSPTRSFPPTWVITATSRRWVSRRTPVMEVVTG